MTRNGPNLNALTAVQQLRVRSVRYHLIICSRFGGRGDRVKRREFITLLGSAATMPLQAAWAQEPERLRRSGVLISIAEDDPETRRRIPVFEEELRKLGWTAGRTTTITYRFGGGDTNRLTRPGGRPCRKE